jgi:hypothetical protein
MKMDTSLDARLKEIQQSRKAFVYENVSSLGEDAKSLLSSEEAIAALMACVIALESVVPGTAENLLIRLALIDDGFRTRVSVRPELAERVTRAEQNFVDYLKSIIQDVCSNDNVV